jgi:hypothetical protein
MRHFLATTAGVDEDVANRIVNDLVAATQPR